METVTQFTAAAAISTMHITLACAAHRLRTDNGTVTANFKEVISACLKKNKDVKEKKWNPEKYSDYIKVLYLPARTYQRCDVKKYIDGKKFMKYLEEHTTYKLSKSYNNRLTWYQISEIVRFTVDLLEECYEAGRSELVHFLIDWCVSFINQQSCVHTSDGWADILTVLPPALESSPRNAQISSSSSPLEEGILETMDSDADKVDPLPSLSYSQSSSNASDGGENQDQKESHSTSTAGEMSTESATKQLLLLRCSCGNTDMIRSGKFLGVCNKPDCGKHTCLICCQTFAKDSGFHHLAQHKATARSCITKDHIKSNAAVYNDICPKCKEKGCIAILKNKGHCKQCDTYVCMHPDCRKTGKYSTIQTHVLRKEHWRELPHENLVKTYSKSTKSADLKESKELHLLRCSCKNLENFAREGKFFIKCRITTCNRYNVYMCLICGRTMKRRQHLHLGRHDVDFNGLITDSHIESNLKLYNKVCPKCGQQSSGYYPTINVYKVAKCRCCNAHMCMFPECNTCSTSRDEVRKHYSSKHSHV